MTGVAAEATAFALTWMTERACYERLAHGDDLTDDFQTGLVHVWVSALYGR